MAIYVSTWLRLKTDRHAVTALEYGLIGAVLMATIMVGFHSLANALSTEFSNIGGSL